MTRLRRVELHRDGQRRVMAIESVTLHQAKFSNGVQLYGSVTPLAIVVCTSAGNEVVVVGENNTSLATLKTAYPGLDALLADICYRENMAD